MSYQYKWLVVITFRNGEESPLLESRWFDSKIECKRDFNQRVLKEGYDLPDSCGSKEYIVRRKEIPF
jgi:hypothetical protein